MKIQEDQIINLALKNKRKKEFEYNTSVESDHKNTLSDKMNTPKGRFTRASASRKRSRIFKLNMWNH